MSPTRVLDLRCDYQVDPAAVESLRPRLFWRLESDERGVLQSHYRILAATCPDLLEPGKADLWDSGLVASEETTHIPYGGREPKPWQTVWWTAMSVVGEGGATEWAAPASWSLGPQADEDWGGAKWIVGPDRRAPRRAIGLGHGIHAPKLATRYRKDTVINGPPRGDEENELPPVKAVILRKDFEVADPSAFDWAVLQGHADFHGRVWVNGVEVGQIVIWGHIAHYDVKALLRPGTNTIGVYASRSHLGDPYIALALEAGKGAEASLRVESDESWLCRVSNDTRLAAGPIDASEWQHAKAWIAKEDGPWANRGVMPEFLPPPRFRKEFAISNPIRRARIAVCGLGYHELFLNGERVGDRRLDPGQTDYDKRALFVVHDVTAQVRQGANALGIVVADGFFNQEQTWGGMSYGPPTALACLRIEHEDGSVACLATDGNWRTAEGPVRAAHIYSGEEHDARLEQPGWDAPGFDDSAWDPAIESPGPGGRLEPMGMPPIRAVEEFEPVSLSFPCEGLAVYDLGQNIAGVARIRVEEPAGTRIVLRYAEALGPDGVPDYDSTGPQMTNFVQRDEFICKGGGVEEFEPRFVYHGFQYVDVSGWSKRPGRGDLVGVALHTDAEEAGGFSCSDPFLEKVHKAAKWTLRGNMHSILTDCPARERCGWLGDAHVDAEMAIFNYDMAGFLAKYLRDIETSLGAEGLPTMVAPGKRTCGSASPDWGCALPMIAWYQYLYYGDRAVLEEHYPSMARWVRHLDAISKDGIVESGLGDWCFPNPDGPEHPNPAHSPHHEIPLSSTAYYYFNLRILSEASRALGRERDAEVFAARGRVVKEAFIGRFFDEGRKSFGSQTADSMALYLGLAPEEHHQAVADSLAADVRARGDHFTTGIHGFRHLFWALSEYGHGDAAMDCIHAEGYPGFKFLFGLGATTIWERWGEGWRPDRDFAFYSMNHPMQAGFDAWFFNGLGGISPSDEDPGFKRILLQPHFVPGLESVDAWHRSIRGVVRSAWSRGPEGLAWRIEIPANTTALVFVPADSPAQVLVGDAVADDIECIEFLAHQGGTALLQVGSGSYDFRVLGGVPAVP